MNSFTVRLATLVLLAAALSAATPGAASAAGVTGGGCLLDVSVANFGGGRGAGIVSGGCATAGYTVNVKLVQARRTGNVTLASNPAGVWNNGRSFTVKGSSGNVYAPGAQVFACTEIYWFGVRVGGGCSSPIVL